MWIEDAKAAVIADAHLGYGWAQRRRGELGPVADDGAASKLAATVSELGALTIVFAGDLVHAPRPGKGEREFVEQSLRTLRECAGIVAVRGNHDRKFARDFASLGIETMESWSYEDLVVIHGDRIPDPVPEDTTLVLGHIHPSAVVIDAAEVSRKVPVFLVSESAILLPAFSPFAGGFDVGASLPPELERILSGTRATIAATGGMVAPLGPLRPVFHI